MKRSEAMLRQYERQYGGISDCVRRTAMGECKMKFESCAEVGDHYIATFVVIESFDGGPAIGTKIEQRIG